MSATRKFLEHRSSALIRSRLLLTAFVSLLVAVCSQAAFGQEADRATELLDHLGEKPADMDTDVYKERRRDAAIELGRLKERRAVPALINVIETVEFDIVVEHAIEALARIGDQRAVQALEKVAADKDRDSDARTAARRALKQLGQQATSDPPDDDDDDDNTDAPTEGTRILGGTTIEAPSPQAFPDDTIAATERIVFAVGDVRLAYDTVRDIPSIDGNVSAEYLKVLERTKLGLTYGGRAGAVAGGVNFPGPDSSSQTIAADGDAFGEVRFYVGNDSLFGFAGARVGTALQIVEIDRPMDDDTSERYFGFDAGATIGVGAGRVIERGAVLRLERIEAALKSRRLLGRAITADLRERILAAWWGLRRDISPYRQLVLTISLLREAGVLLDAPGPEATYHILRILEDGQLSNRPSGWSAALGISESFLVRDNALDLEEGRIENVIARARFALQQDGGSSEILSSAVARYRVLGEDGESAPWLASASLAFRRYFYTDNFDPIGALEFGGEVGVSNDGLDDSDTASRIGGSVGWLFSFNRASRVRLAANASLEGKELFVGATLAASYGFLDVSFVGK